MGKYDNYDRDYFCDKEVAAQLFTWGIFHGKLKVAAENLAKEDARYQSLRTVSGTIERDGKFLCEKYKALMGLEIETKNDLRMPERILAYDGCEYEKQIKEIKKAKEKHKKIKTYDDIKSGLSKDDRLLPIVNLVLYLGQGHWHGNRTLIDLFDFEKKSEAYIYDKVENYGFSLIEADYVDPYKFSTELKNFFLAMQCRTNKRKLMQLVETEEFQNLSHSTQEIIAIHLNDGKILKRVVEEDEEMCQALRELYQDWKNEGIEQGIEQGVAKGELINLKENIKSLMDNAGYSFDRCLELLNVNEVKAAKVREIFD